MRSSTVVLPLLVACLVLIADADAFKIGGSVKVKGTNVQGDNLKGNTIQGNSFRRQALKQKKDATELETSEEEQTTLAEICPNFHVRGDATLSDIEKTFAQADADGDGKLSPGELEVFANMAGMANACKEFEKSNQG